MSKSNKLIEILNKSDLIKGEGHARRVNLDDLTRAAVNAAIKVIDDATDNTGSAGPMGDELANKLDKIIRKAIEDHFNHEDHAPAWIKLEKD